MPFTPTYQNVKPVVGGSADTWGGTNNDRIGEAYADFQSVSTLLNAVEASASAALPRAGGTLTGDVVVADVAASSTRSVGFRGVPVVSIGVDRTFGLTDAGKMIRLFGPNVRTWTIPNTSTVGFQIGTTIVLRNYATANLSLVRAAGVALRIPGSSVDANRTLVPYALVTLVMEDTNLWLVSGVGAS